MIYIFWSCRNLSEAETVIHGLLNEHLIACASVLPEVKSIYRWQGKIEEATETKVILKTRAELFDPVKNYICRHCSYEVPEIVQVDVKQGHLPYISWVEEETLNPTYPIPRPRA